MYKQDLLSNRFYLNVQTKFVIKEILFECTSKIFYQIDLIWTYKRCQIDLIWIYKRCQTDLIWMYEQHLLPNRSYKNVQARFATLTRCTPKFCSPRQIRVWIIIFCEGKLMHICIRPSQISKPRRVVDSQIP